MINRIREVDWSTLPDLQPAQQEIVSLIIQLDNLTMRPRHARNEADLLPHYAKIIPLLKQLFSMITPTEFIFLREGYVYSYDEKINKKSLREIKISTSTVSIEFEFTTAHGFAELIPLLMIDKKKVSNFKEVRGKSPYNRSIISMEKYRSYY